MLEEPPHDLPGTTKTQCVVVAQTQLKDRHPWLFLPDEEPGKWMEQSLFSTGIDSNFDLRGSYTLQSPPHCHPALEMLLAPGLALVQNIIGSGPISQQGFHGDKTYHRFLVLREGSNPPPECGEHRTEPGQSPFDYCQNHKWVKNDIRGFAEFECLGHPKEIKQPGSTFCKALALSSIAIRQAIMAVNVDGVSIWPPGQKQEDVYTEVFNILQYLVNYGCFDPIKDLRFILENFGWTKPLAATNQVWSNQMLIAMVRRGCLPNHADLEVLTDVLKERIQEEPDMYPTVDIRAWPLILIDFLQLKPSEVRNYVDPYDFGLQIKFQLCVGPVAQLEANHLEAAKILDKLELQAPCFTAEEFLDLFNQNPNWNRLLLLREGLRSASSDFRQEVLRLIDADIDQLDIGRDDNAILLQGLIDHLREDLRCCDNLFYAIKRNWIRARVTDMSAEQLCDYIETDPNHALLLKDVVNRLHTLKHYFQAAKILVRKKSQGTTCFEAHQNDPLLGYLRELYSEADDIPDRLGPIEEGSLILPISSCHPNYLRVADKEGAELALQRLSHDLELNAPPTRSPIIGIYWQWLCFNAQQDLWPQASSISIAYEVGGQNVFVFFDLYFLDTCSGLSDAGQRAVEACKQMLRRILEAHHILKVVHNMNSQSLAILQRAVAPRGCFYREEKRARLEPFMEVSLLLAFARSTTPVDGGCYELANAVRDYLRLELCTAEAMMNPCRRPLRESQVHYALTMAWCPLLIARVLCSSDTTCGEPKVGHIWPDEVSQFIFAAPPDGHDWSHHLWNSSFGKATQNDHPPIEAPARKDVWFEQSEEARDFRKNLPEPFQRERLAETLEHLRSIRITQDSPLAPLMGTIVQWLCYTATAQATLKVLYEAQEQAIEVAETGGTPDPNVFDC
mmetsp:Transcript_54409/g.119108  ORF Transcript_54409/g.119108 Transcript_54409/m.119108 type:complete len:904 (-) Transcript_54409:296-3007(-)